MGLLEKLRGQPKHKHADPAIRLEGVVDLEEGSADLVVLASDDPDARVRRAAVARVHDAHLLASIVRNESDGHVREAATSQLVRVAGGAESTALPAVTALASLALSRELGAIARGQASPAARLAATEHVLDEKVLGGIARQAPDAAVRLLAVGRLNDVAELDAVALRGDHADAAVAALERLTAPTDDTLRALAERARAKAVQKRARALLRARADEATRVPTDVVEYRDADQAQARQLLAQMESLNPGTDAGQLRANYGMLRAAWVELMADAEVLPDVTAGFEAASDRVRQALQADDAARAAAAREQQARQQEQAERAAVCVEVENLPLDAGPEALLALDARWTALPPMPDSWASEMQMRYDAARRGADRRRARHEAMAALVAQAPEWVTQAEALADATDYAAVRPQWLQLRRQWQQLPKDAALDPALVERFNQVTARMDVHETTHRDARNESQQHNLHRLQSDVQDLETRAGAEGLSLRDAEQILKQTRLVVGTMGPLPTKQDREDLTVRLQAVRAAVTPRIKELRDAEEWKRWANVQIQEELCTKMEALVPLADAEPEKAASEMRALQERWRGVAAAPRSQAESLWTRFKAAQDQVYEKCKDFFAQQAVERQENQKKKDALAARAEALAESTDWVKAADALKQLQAEWKAIGPVTRGHEKAVWERFRTACDKFFTRRHEDLKERKSEWSANLAKKEALIVEAEQLAQSNEWDRAAQRLKALQVEWKKIGPVRKNKSEAIWQRFRAACDVFFERFKTRDQVVISGKVADRETAVAEIEALVPAPDATDAPMPDDLYSKVQASRARYLQGPDVPRHVLAPLGDRLNQALLALVTRWPAAFANTDLDPEGTRRKMDKLVSKVEALVPNETAEPAPKNLSPAELLARQWREALAANTMGAAAARQAEEARHRAVEQEVRSAQAAWQRLGPIDPALRRPLQERFDRACRRFMGRSRPGSAR